MFTFVAYTVHFCMWLFFGRLTVVYKVLWMSTEHS